MFDDFSNNRKYALAWVLLAVLFAFALQINVIVRQGAVPGGAVPGGAVPGGAAESPAGKVK
jgi:hypothetical protein